MTYVYAFYDVLKTIWSIVTIPYVALGYVPFVGSALQSIVSGAFTVVVLWYAWKFLPRRLTAAVMERVRSAVGWVLRKSGGAVGALVGGERIVYKDRVVYKTSWRARAGFFVKDVLIALFLALGATLYFNKTVIPWLSWVGGMVR